MNYFVVTPTNPQGELAELIAEEAQELEATAIARQAEREANQWIVNRQASYPSIQEQLDMQYWDSVNGTTTWADAIAAVKAANPKPE